MHTQVSSGPHTQVQATRAFPPGVLDTSASSFLPVSMLMRLDLPTFERPITAISGCRGAGHWDNLTLLVLYSADFIWMLPTLKFWSSSDSASRGAWLSPSSDTSAKQVKDPLSASARAFLELANMQHQSRCLRSSLMASVEWSGLDYVHCLGQLLKVGCLPFAVAMTLLMSSAGHFYLM